MENQHRKINGYRELSQEEIDLINDVKQLGEQTAVLLDKVMEHLLRQDNVDTGSESGVLERERLSKAEPFVWFWGSRTELQTALMKLTRSIAQPTTF